MCVCVECVVCCKEGERGHCACVPDAKMPLPSLCQWECWSSLQHVPAQFARAQHQSTSLPQIAVLRIFRDMLDDGNLLRAPGGREVPLPLHLVLPLVTFDSYNFTALLCEKLDP